MPLFQKSNAPLALKRARFDLTADSYVNVRELSSQEFMDMQKTVKAAVKQGAADTDADLDFIYSIVATCVCDDDGVAMFDSVDDVKANFNVGFSVLKAIQDKVLALSGMDSPKN